MIESGTVRNLPNILDVVGILFRELLAKVLECTFNRFSFALKCRLTPPYKAARTTNVVEHGKPERRYCSLCCYKPQCLVSMSCVQVRMREMNPES